MKNFSYHIFLCTHIFIIINDFISPQVWLPFPVSTFSLLPIAVVRSVFPNFFTFYEWMWLLLEKRWLPSLSSFFSLLPILSLFDLKSDFFFVSFIFFAFFPEALIASQTSIAWRKHSLHLIGNIITLNGAI